MAQTPNIGLAKPSYDDSIEVDVLNGNFDILDTVIGEIISEVGNKADTETVETLKSEMRNSIAQIIDSGAKNRLLPQNGSFSTHGAAITVKDDEIIISGETDTASNIFWNLYANADKKINIPVGDWVASLDIQTDDIRFAVYADNALVARGNWGEPLQFNISDGKTSSWMRIELKPETVYNETIRAMLCSATEYAVSQKFVQYVPSNDDIMQIVTDLSARVAALETT